MIETEVVARDSTIGRLNDRCRQGLDRTARIVVTSTCLASSSDDTTGSRVLAHAQLLRGLRQCDFDPRDAERSRGRFTVQGVEVHFTIDYYDTTLEWGSEDPADASVTTRVLTLMLREDL